MKCYNSFRQLCGGNIFKFFFFPVWPVVTVLLIRWWQYGTKVWDVTVMAQYYTDKSVCPPALLPIPLSPPNSKASMDFTPF